MSGSGGHDGGEMWWKFLGDGPLIEPGIGASPHRHFAIAKRLFRQPFGDIKAVAAFIFKGPELATRISAATNVYQRVHVAVRGKIHGAIGVRITDVGREGEDYGKRVFLRVRLVDSGV